MALKRISPNDFLYSMILNLRSIVLNVRSMILNVRSKLLNGDFL